VSQSNPVTPRPSSAVVLARERAGGGVAVFMVRRHVASEFMPDVFVFPGGSVNETDTAAERAAGLCAPAGDDGPTGLGRGFRAAALRECFEEAGVLLARRGPVDGPLLAISSDETARFAAYRDALNNRTTTIAEVARREGLTLATDALLHWAHWITPATFPKRFDTHFFLAAMPPQQEAAHDRLETSDGVWVTPEEALARAMDDDFPLAAPTEYQLRDLAGLADLAAVRKRFAGSTPRTIEPRAVRRDEGDVILMPWQE